MRFSVFTRVAMISAALCATKAVDIRENSALAHSDDQLADKMMMAQLGSWVAPVDNEAILAQADAQVKPDDPALVEEVCRALHAMLTKLHEKKFSEKKKP